MTRSQLIGGALAIFALLLGKALIGPVDTGFLADRIVPSVSAVGEIVNFAVLPVILRVEMPDRGRDM